MTRRGDWIQTYSGRAFYPLDPRPEDIEIVDIAHALAHQCRYAGHCRSFYSVAQHSCLVASVLPPELVLWGLLHDASEAYLVDVPRPVKPYLIGYAEAERRLMAVICQRFGLAPEMPDEVKRVDNAILEDERLALMAPAPKPWNIGPGLGIRVYPWDAETARDAFLAAFHDTYEAAQ